MLSTKLYIKLANAFHHARDSGYHNQVIPPPKDLNSELVGLLSYKKECTSKVHKKVTRFKTHTCEPYLTPYFKHFKHGLW